MTGWIPPDVAQHGGYGDNGSGGVGLPPTTTSSSTTTGTAGTNTTEAKKVEHGRLLIALSEGPIGGLVNGLKSVYLDGTPIQNSDNSFNFAGVSVGMVSGTNTQAYIPGFVSAESEVSVNTQVTTAAMITKTISTTGLSAVRVNVKVPALKVINSTTGAESGTKVLFEFQRQSASWNGGAWETVPFLEDPVSGGVYGMIEGKFGSPYIKGYRIELPSAGPWQIRMKRWTNDAPDAYTQNDTWWDSYTEITDAKLRRPNTACLGVLLNAEVFPSLPQVHAECYGVYCHVPTNYDPIARTYATTGPGTSGGTWDGTFKLAWTNNPAWLFYETAINTRWGAGVSSSRFSVSKWELYAISQVCDEDVPDGLGGTEPRFTCSIHIQGQQNAITVLGNLASAFRGMLYSAGGQVMPVQDVDESPVALFTPANVAGGNFEYQGVARQARHNSALITWNDPTAGYAQAVEAVEDAASIARYGYNPIEIQGFGLTTQGAAQRLGLYVLLSEKLNAETVSFEPGLDSMNVRPGNIIQVDDPKKGGVGGRVLAATTTQITLDRPVVLASGQTYTLKCRLETGAVESRTVTTAAGTVSMVTVGTAFSAAPPFMGVWGLHEASSARLYRVVSIKDNGPLKRQVTALYHDPAKYDLCDLPTVTAFTAGTPIAATAPANLVVTAGISTRQNVISPFVSAVWTANTKAIGYRADASLDYGPWLPMRLSGCYAELVNAEPGDYRIRVVAIYPHGRSSIPTQSTVNVPDTDLPPALQGLMDDVDDISADGKFTPSEKKDIRLRWNIIAAEKAGLDSQATAFGITTEKTTYDTNFQALANYLNNGTTWTSGVPTWIADANLGTTTTITRATFRSKFEDYFSGRTGLVNAVEAKAKSLADLAQGDATTALSTLSDIASDSKFTAVEKSSVRGEWNVIASEKSTLDTQATAFGITTAKTTYDNAFQALATYLNAGTTWTSGIPSWIADANLGTTTSITPATFRTNFQTYYDARTALVAAISAVAKALADGAQSGVDTINNDDTLSRAKKPELLIRYNTELQTKTDLDAKATTLSVSSTAYDNAVAAVTAFLQNLGGSSPNWAYLNMATDTSLGTGGGASLRTLWNTVASTRAALQSAIAGAYPAYQISVNATDAMRKADFLDVNGKIPAVSKLTPGSVDATILADLAVTSAKIADGAVLAAKIADASLTVAKFATGIRPVRIVSSLPATPWTGYVQGDCVTLTTDNKLYRFTGSGWTAAVHAADLSGALATAQIADSAITAAKIADASLTVAKFASGLRPVRIVSSLPATPWTGYVQGDCVTLTTDNKLYRFTGAGWTAAVPATDLSGSITTTQITDNAVTTEKIAALAVTANEIAAGAITAIKIEANTITAACIAAGAITTSELAAGAVTASKILITGRGAALNADPACEDLTAWTNVSTLITGITDLPVGSTAIANVAGDYTAAYSLLIPVDAARNYHLEFLFKQVGATAANAYAGVQWYDAAKVGINSATVAPAGWQNGAYSYMPTCTNTVIPTAWTKYSINFGPDETAKIPTSAKYLKLIALLNFNSTASAQIYMSGVRLWQRADGDLIVDGTVTAAKLDALAVTADKIAANTITGAKIAANTITAANIAANTITAGTIAVGAIGTTELAANAVTAAKIAVGTITANEIASDAITTAKIAAGAVTAAEIAAGAITTVKLAAGAVTANEIAALTITAAKIAANTLTGDKIAANTITGDLVAANTILAKNLTVANFDNLIPNPTSKYTDDNSNDWPYGSYEGAGIHNNSGTLATLFNPPENGGHRYVEGNATAITLVQITPWLPCKAGESYYLEGAVCSMDGGNVGFYVQFSDQDYAGYTGYLSTGSTGVWNVVLDKIRLLAPATVETSGNPPVKMRVFLRVNAHATPNRGRFNFFYLRRCNDANTIVDGTLTTLFCRVGNDIQSTNYSAGTTGNAPVGMRISAFPFTATYIDGTTDATCQMEIGGSVNIAGYKAATVADLACNRSKIYSSPGTYSWTCPPMVYSLEVTLIGAGAGGAGAADTSNGGGGGGSGACGICTFEVTPGTTYTIVVGAKGLGGAYQANGVAGGDSSLSGGGVALLLAQGGRGGYAAGTGGAGGAMTWVPGAGSISQAGGAAGAAGVYKKSYTAGDMWSGSGGGSRGTSGGASSDGNPAGGASGGTGQGGGGGSAPNAMGTDGGSSTTAATDASSHGAGGGGGGTYASNRTGGNGSDGWAQIRWW